MFVFVMFAIPFFFLCIVQQKAREQPMLLNVPPKVLMFAEHLSEKQIVL